MSWLRKRSPFIVVSGLLGTLMILFILLPILGTLTNSAQGIPAALIESRTENAIFTSFYCAFIATLLVLIIGVPLAYILTHHPFHGKKLLDSLIDLPVLIPHNAAGIALLSIFSSGALVGGMFSRFGISFIDTTLGIMIAMAFVSSPFMIRNAQEAFANIDPRMEQVARSLGGSSFQVFKEVTLPLAWKGILSGCLLTWARAVSEFGAVIVLAYYPQTAPIYLYDLYASEGLQAALPVTGVLIILAIIIFLIFRMVTDRPTRFLQRMRRGSK
jgi:molybdate/tungstate transport system permease protein